MWQVSFDKNNLVENLSTFEWTVRRGDLCVDNLVVGANLPPRANERALFGWEKEDEVRYPEFQEPKQCIFVVFDSMVDNLLAPWEGCGGGSTLELLVLQGFSPQGRICRRIHRGAPGGAGISVSEHVSSGH